MLFSSIIFLIAFLPAVLVGHLIAPKPVRNVFLLLASLLFYAWGEVYYVFLMIVSILLNYGIGMGLNIAGTNQTKKWILGIGITANVALLVYYKYAAFLYDMIVQPFSSNDATTQLDIHLPIGISFFTFQSISYLIDVYRKEVPAQKNPVSLGLFISLFPQLIAGPIVRYSSIARELSERTMSIPLFSTGIQRFVIGLSKKVLLANPLALMADQIFATPIEDVSSPVAWLGIICYTLQIYYDFSGYSDMAIGLGKMLGFHFLENFNFPYIARSIQDFWRRWHISLSSWFRDYLYIPLGGNRKGPYRTYFNLFFVFFITGLWHGANWNFIFWGLFHGCFLVLERVGFNRILNKLWAPFAHLYTLLVVIIAWVFFRIENLDEAFQFVGKLFGMNASGSYDLTPYYFANYLNIIVLIVGILGSTKLFHIVPAYFNRLPQQNMLKIGYQLTQAVLIFAILAMCMSELASDTYNPFIYYRF